MLTFILGNQSMLMAHTLVVSKAPKAIMLQIGEEFNLKAGYGLPDTFLGAEVEKFQMPDARWHATLEHKK